MKQEIVEKALHTVDMVYISELFNSGNSFMAGRILGRALNVLGDKPWILAGLGAIELGHPELAASFAIADFFSTFEALEPPEAGWEDPDQSPYLLHGEELDKAVARRKSGLPGQGILEWGAILGFIGIVLLAIYIVLMPSIQQGIQHIPAPQSIQMLSDASIQAIAANDALVCSTMPSNHAQIAHGSAAWEAINACKNAPNPIVHINPTTHRKMTGCQYNGKFYVVIDDADGNNVTAYPKDEFKFLDELIRYFRFSGYTR
jgi:hypothetical protein